MSSEKVLVTGADGFIGSHLVEELVKSGKSVKAFVYYNSFNSWGWIDTLDKEIINEIEIFAGDIRDPNGVRTAVKDTSLVYHLAALIAIPFSYHSPDSYIDTNVKGTLNVMQACKDYGTERVLVTSTSEVYGTAQYVPIDEKHPRQPQSPYSASKIGADCIAESFYRSFDTPVTIVRPFNTFGPRQSARAIIPTIISQLLNQTETLKLGDVYPTRDLLYVKDTVQAFMSIADTKTLIGEDCNIATNTEISIGDLAEKLITLLSPGTQIVQENERMRPEKSEVYRLWGTADKLKQQTDWTPKHTFDEALAITVEWFRDPANLSKYKSNIYNV
jgi:NAD dependent epimerase/dehydratase